MAFLAYVLILFLYNYIYTPDQFDFIIYIKLNNLPYKDYKNLNRSINSIKLIHKLKNIYNKQNILNL